MEEQLAKRDATQPTKDRTAGSTFRNPVGLLLDRRGRTTCHELKAWKLIEDAGLRGARLGGRGDVAEARELPDQRRRGDSRRSGRLWASWCAKRFSKISGISLEWEIMRVGEPTR